MFFIITIPNQQQLCQWWSTNQKQKKCILNTEKEEEEPLLYNKNDATVQLSWKCEDLKNCVSITATFLMKKSMFVNKHIDYISKFNYYSNPLLSRFKKTILHPEKESKNILFEFI